MKYILIFFSYSLIFPDTILLKNGTFLRGKTILKDDVVIIETFDGKSKSVPKSEILKIDLRNISEKEVKEIREQEEKLEILRKERIKKANEDLEKKILLIKQKMKESNEEENKKLIQELENLKKQIKEVEEDNSVTLFGPFIRSSVLPGWGNIFVGNAKKKPILKFFGFTYLGISLLLLGNSANNYLNVLDKKNNYDSKVQEYFYLNALFTSTQIPNPNLVYGIYFLSDKNYSEYKTANINYNQSIQALGFVYLIQLAQAYYLGYSSYSEYLASIDKEKFIFKVSFNSESNLIEQKKSENWEIKIESKF